MDRKKIENSSRVSEIGYDPFTQTLQVRFRKGGIYNYTPVTSEQYQELMAAESVGEAMNKIVKDKSISYKKVGK